MIKRQTWLGLGFAVLAGTGNASAAIQVFQPTSTAGTPGVRFKLPYTMGTHDGEAHEIKGSVHVDLAAPKAATGELHVPIASLTTGNAERDCHLREAMGLDYKTSDFPKDHLCDSQHQLPKAGKNAVVFPEIVLKITSIESSGPHGAISADQETAIALIGSFTMHGESRPVRIPLQALPEAGGFRLKGSLPLSLAAYGIQVKSAHIVFVTISVDDTVTLNFDLPIIRAP